MTDILEKFNFSSKITDEFKQTVKLFHIFYDIPNSKSNFIVTTDDRVFAFGNNSNGMCGFGHDKRVNSPEEVPELSGKQIKQFFIGGEFVLALNKQNQVFGWGWNQFGQLARGYTNEWDGYLKPELISDLFNNQKIVEISCGYCHSLALDSMGNVFAWGGNFNGQIGCGKKLGVSIRKPIHLNILPAIKSIYCTGNKSFAISFDGLVYSWGNYDYFGNQTENKSLFQPKLVNQLNNVLSVGINSRLSVNYRNVKNFTYFLTKEGNVYFCENIDSNEFQNLIKLGTSLKFETMVTINSKWSFNIYFSYYSNTLITSGGIVYCLKGNSIKKTKYITISDYCLFEERVTIRTVEREYIKLGSGQFGTVFKWMDKNDQKEYALKKISLNKQDESIAKLKRELLIVSGCNEIFVVKYYESWVKDNNFFIKMELCSTNLNQVIQDKDEIFKTTNAMTIIEYYISCQLLKELLECVQYLHEMKPNPIIHRNLKPENILVNNTTNNGRFIKLCDFGFAIPVSENNKPTSHTLIEKTPKYIAPEIFGDKNLRADSSTKADIYSLGIIVCDLFRYDFDGLNEELKNNVELKEQWLELEIFIDQMLNSRHHRRPNCAQILAKSNLWLIDRVAVKDDQEIVTAQPRGFIYNYILFKLDSNLVDTNTNTETKQYFNVNFDKIADLDSGSFGNVIKARNKSDQKIYAIKIIEMKIDDKHTFLEYQSEVKLISKCSVEYVVEYYNSWIENNKLYIQMELFSDNLKNIIKQKTMCFARKDMEPMTITEFFISSQIFKEILDCIHYLHNFEPEKSIIHRDLKPENILVNKVPKKGKFIKLADFGLATFCTSTISQTNSMGTIKYMAPEILNATISKPKYSQKTDIYSLGKILSDLFDYDMNSIDQSIKINPALEEQWNELEELVDKMLTTKYHFRPNTTQILENYQFWKIDIAEQVKDQLDRLEMFHDNFFHKYLSSKLNITSKKY